MLEKFYHSKKYTVVLFFLLAFICYGWILDTPFKIVDDYMCIVDNPLIKNLANTGKIFTQSFFGHDNSYYRPLVSFSFMVEYRLFKLNHIFYNLNNILLHIGCALLVWGIGRRLLKDAVSAFFVALIFLIHPVQWEHITNIPGRAILLCAFFFLSSFYFLIKSLEDAAPRKKSLLFLMSAASFGLSLISKESAVVFPGVAAAYLIFAERRPDLRRKFLIVFVYGLILAFYLWIRFSLGISKGLEYQTPYTVFLAVLTFVKSLFLHAYALVIPGDLVYDRSLDVFRDLNGWMPWALMACVAAAGASLLVFRRNISGLSFFWLSWIFLNFLTVSQLVPIYVSSWRVSIADHFLYLPSVGCFVFLVEGFRRARQFLTQRQILKPAVSGFIIAAWLVFLVFVTIIQTLTASNPIVLFERALEDNPANVRVRNALATTYGFAGYSKEAEHHFREVLKYAYFDAKARIGLGKALCDQNKCMEALDEYRKVVNPGPEDVHLLKDNMEKTYPIVLREYTEKLRRFPDDPEVHHALARVYMYGGDVERAITHLKKTVELKPDYPQVSFALGNILQKFSRMDEALFHYQQALKYIPADQRVPRWMTLQQMAGIYRFQGQMDKAVECERQAAEEEKAFKAEEINSAKTGGQP